MDQFVRACPALDVSASDDGIALLLPEVNSCATGIISSAGQFRTEMCAPRREGVPSHYDIGRNRGEISLQY